MSCEVVQSECLRLGVRVPITLDLSLVAARRWRPGALFDAAIHIRGSKAGFEFEAGADGQTGDREPRWPKVLDDTVQDGSIEWTAKAVSTASLLKVLSSVEWEADDSITVTGEQINATDQTAVAYFEPTEAGTFTIICWATFNDSPSQKEAFAIELEVT